MHDSDELDELDLSLLAALQTRPRAPWSVVGDALDVDAATVGRRWSRLTANGRAWVTAYPGSLETDRLCLALIEVQCTAGRTEEVSEYVARDPQVITVEHTTGSRDLLLTLFTPDLDTLSRRLAMEIEPLAGVRASRTHVVTELHTEGSRWRLPTLDPWQKDTLQRSAQSTGGQALSSAALTSLDRRIAIELGLDGRIRHTDLAERLGISVNTARRRVSGLITSGRIVLRCELSRSLSGWPVSAVLWGQVPPNILADTARLIGSIRETRLVCAVTGGPANLLCALWMRSVGDLQRFEAELLRLVPELAITDRALALQHAKRLGRLLDADGRSVRAVPMDVWAARRA